MRLNKHFKPIHILLSILMILFFIIFGVCAIVTVGTKDIIDIRTTTISFICAVIFINLNFFHLRKVSQILLEVYEERLKRNEKVSLVTDIINDNCEMYYIFSGVMFGISVMIGLLTPVMYMILWFSLDINVSTTIITAIIMDISAIITFLNIFKIITLHKKIKNTYTYIRNEIMRQ